MLSGFHARSFGISVFKRIYDFPVRLIAVSHCFSVKCGHEIHSNIAQAPHDTAVEIVSRSIGYLRMKFNVAAHISVKVIAGTAVGHFIDQAAQLGDLLRRDRERCNCGYAGFQITADLAHVFKRYVSNIFQVTHVLTKNVKADILNVHT